MKLFDVIAISESRIPKDTNLTTLLNLIQLNLNQVEPYILYINNKLSYKVRQDLCIYKSSELESTFIEIINPKKTKYYHWLYIYTSNNESQ